MARALLAWNDKHELHDGNMNECADRVRSVVHHLKRYGVWDQCESAVLPPGVVAGEVLAAAERCCRGIHSMEHLKALESTASAYFTSQGWYCPLCTSENPAANSTCFVCAMQMVETAKPEQQFMIPEGKAGAVYLCEGSLEAALHGCQVCVQVSQQVWQGGVPGAFSLIRPPGHHAASEHFGSYCLLNNIAITAQTLLEIPDGPNRILVVDWDVHHGDGTQAIMEQVEVLREQCAFVSIHRHDKDFWPATGGVEEGGSNVVNVPLTGRGYGDADYLHVFLEVVMPLIEKWGPDMVLVSAGYDCADGDPIGRMSVTPAGFHTMSRLLLDAQPSVFVLEGGYDVGSSEPEHARERHLPLCTGVEATIKALLEAPSGLEPRQFVNDTHPDWESAIKDETRRVAAVARKRVRDGFAV